MLSVNFNPAINNGRYQNKFAQKRAVSSNFANQKQPLKNDCFQKSQISFCGKIISYEEEQADQYVKENLKDWENFSGWTLGAPGGCVKIYNFNFFLEREIKNLIDRGLYEHARKLMDALNVVPYRLEGEVIPPVPAPYSNPLTGFATRKSGDNRDSVEVWFELNENNCYDFHDFDNLKQDAFLPKGKFDRMIEYSFSNIDNFSDDGRKTILKEKLDKIQNDKIEEDKKEAVRKQLRPFVEKLARRKENDRTRLNNCVMFVGDDIKNAFDAANWLQDICVYNKFDYLPGTYDSLKDMQDDLVNKLESAQERYEKTHNQTLLFAPYLGELLKESKNSPEDIAEMKLIMQEAQEDYNTTILFFATPDDIKEFDKGIIHKNRIGLEVQV